LWGSQSWPQPPFRRLAQPGPEKVEKEMTMKPIFALTGMMLAVCALACAQDDAGRIVVPARNTSQPRVVVASSSNGSITVKTYAGKEVIVESGDRKPRDRDRNVPDGMHRIDIPERGLVVEEADNTITIQDHTPGGTHITITVPPDTSLKLSSHNGSLYAEGVHGEIDAECQNGGIKLVNVSGAVLADSHNGGINVTLDHVDTSKPSAFSSVNGAIDVTLPADLKANLKMRSSQGSIYSDFDMNVTTGRATTQKNNTSDGKFRLEFDRTILAAINGGGTEMTFTTVNGSILIRKKK
jgi:predicted membrane protein